MAIEIDADNDEIQRIVPVLRSLQEACDELGLAFFVIGAFARNLHLNIGTTLTSPAGHETWTWRSP